MGPNGAGKSTTIKMLTGILTPSAGRLRVAGIDPSRERTRLARRIGVVFGQRTTLWWDLPADRLLPADAPHVPDPDARYRENLDRCVELLDLEALLDVPVRQLSLGQRMRGDIGAALLHDPEVLFLEPTIGLDVISKAKVRSFLRDLNAERGTTVLLTTHDLTDIERLSPRVMVIDHGRLMYDGPLIGLHEVESERTLVVDLERELPPIEVDSARVVKVEGPRQWLTFRRRRRRSWWRGSRPSSPWWTSRCGSRTSRRSSAACTRRRLSRRLSPMTEDAPSRGSDDQRPTPDPDPEPGAAGLRRRS